MVHLRDTYGGGFLWLSDDNFEFGKRGGELVQELKAHGLDDSMPWFFQARMDDIARNPELVSQLQRVGNNWQLFGVENSSPQVLTEFNKGETVEDAAKAVRILRDNGILAQAMMVIGSRRDTAQSIQELREFSLGLDTDLSIFSILTPFPGTEIYEVARTNGWVEDHNYAHYDMIHAVMPTETLTRMEVQEELLECYRKFYGTPISIVRGLFSRNDLKKRAYRHLAGKRILHSLRRLV